MLKKEPLFSSPAVAVVGRELVLEKNPGHDVKSLSS